MKNVACNRQQQYVWNSPELNKVTHDWLGRYTLIYRPMTLHNYVIRNSKSLSLTHTHTLKGGIHTSHYQPPPSLALVKHEACCRGTLFGHTRTDHLRWHPSKLFSWLLMHGTLWICLLSWANTIASWYVSLTLVAWLYLFLVSRKYSFLVWQICQNIKWWSAIIFRQGTACPCSWRQCM